MIIIFGGTSEGRQLAKVCDFGKVEAKICVATEYGSDVLKESQYVKICQGRMDAAEMATFFAKERPRFVMDATHPHAKEVTENIKAVCKQINIEYLRIVREAESSEHCFTNIEEVVDYLKNQDGNVLVATGSKELLKYDLLDKKRIYARVLPTKDSIETCLRLGLENSHILAMQGPFSENMNAAMLEQYHCKFLVTKESGKAGGFEEKIRACEKVGAKSLVIARPTKEEGICLFEAERRILEGTTPCVSIVGIGPGDERYLPDRAKSLIDEAEAIVGAKRMLIRKGVKSLISYRPDEIMAWLENCYRQGIRKMVCLMSGDTGFFSGTNKLLEKLEEKGWRAEVIPGISSISYFASKCKVSWGDAKILSFHGEAKELEVLEENRKIFAITSGGEKNRELMEEVCAFGLGKLRVTVGEDLSYPNEKIFSDTVENLCHYSFGKLSCLLFENPNARGKRMEMAIAEGRFIRDKVPMTKAEVRAISIAMLGICEQDICYDIGAGTGSVSIEMAKFLRGGRVYAVEKKELASNLIAQNVEKFGVQSRVEIHCGSALDVIKCLPEPNSVFIGGSSGDLEEIVDAVYKKNEKATIVINAISLETIAQISVLLSKYEGLGYQTQVIWMSVARGKKVASYHMAMAENPVLIAKIYWED